MEPKFGSSQPDFNMKVMKFKFPNQTITIGYNGSVDAALKTLFDIGRISEDDIANHSVLSEAVTKLNKD